MSGDIVVADASEDYADVGKAIEIIDVGDQKLVSGLHTYIARDRSGKLVLGFGGYLMQSENIRIQIKVLATGVSVLSISKGNLSKVKVPQTYVFANRLPRDQEIVEALSFKPKILERKTILDRVADKIQIFINTFIEGMGGSV